MYDVAVSGAGPAGSYAAYLCARSGLKVVLLEKGSLPREKCCAGGVLERALKHLDFPIPDGVIEKEIKGFSIVHNGFREDFKFDRRAGVTVERSNFDSFLTKKAEHEGVELLENREVTNIKEDGLVAVLCGNEALEARSLIIAEGAISSSASQIFEPYAGKNMGMGMAATYELKEDPTESIEIHLMGTPTSTPWENVFPLNGWLFPHSNAANIGVAGRGSNAETMKKAMLAIVRKADERYGVESAKKIRAHPIPLMPRKALSSRLCLLVGDAAGMANPITGEGMSYALASARLAAEAVADYLLHGRELRDYDRRCREEILYDLRAARIIGPRLHWLVGAVDVDLFFKRFHQSDALVSTCLSIARGEADWRQLLRKTIPRFPSLFFSSLG